MGFLKTRLKKKGVRSGYNYLGQAHPQTLTPLFRLKEKMKLITFISRWKIEFKKL